MQNSLYLAISSQSSCKMRLHIVFLGTTLLLSTHCTEVRVEVYEYFDNVHTSTLDEAKETCEMRGGKLAEDPNFDDWDNNLMSDVLDETILLDTYFSVNIRKSGAGVWEYADGTAVDMTSTRSLTLREIDSGHHGTYDYDCALWNPWEPFFIPTKCKDYNAFLCAIPVTLHTTCEMKGEDDTRFAGKWPGITEVKKGVSLEECKSRCTAVDGTVLPCWAAEFDTSTQWCTLLRLDGKPKIVPDVQEAAGSKTFMKNCKTVAAFEENTCSVLCKCNTQNVVVIPTDEEEYQEFVEAVVKKNQKELTVPKGNLSATIRKKSSATDERESSTGMGALGIAMLTLVFGGLMALDIMTIFVDLNKFSHIPQM